MDRDQQTLSGNATLDAETSPGPIVWTLLGLSHTQRFTTGLVELRASCLKTVGSNSDLLFVARVDEGTWTVFAKVNEPTSNHLRNVISNPCWFTGLDGTSSHLVELGIGALDNGVPDATWTIYQNASWLGTTYQTVSTLWYSGGVAPADLTTILPRVQDSNNTVIDGRQMSETLTSAYIDTRGCVEIALLVQATAGSHVGSITFEVASVPDEDLEAPIALGTYTIPVVASAAVSSVVTIPVRFNYIRVKYTRTSGGIADTLTVTYCRKPR